MARPYSQSTPEYVLHLRSFNIFNEDKSRSTLSLRYFMNAVLIYQDGEVGNTALESQRGLLILYLLITIGGFLLGYIWRRHGRATHSSLVEGWEIFGHWFDVIDVQDLGLWRERQRRRGGFESNRFLSFSDFGLNLFYHRSGRFRLCGCCIGFCFVFGWLRLGLCFLRSCLWLLCYCYFGHCCFIFTFFTALASPFAFFSTAAFPLPLLLALPLLPALALPLASFPFPLLLPLPLPFILAWPLFFPLSFAFFLLSFFGASVAFGLDASLEAKVGFIFEIKTCAAVGLAFGFGVGLVLAGLAGAALAGVVFDLSALPLFAFPSYLINIVCISKHKCQVSIDEKRVNERDRE